MDAAEYRRLSAIYDAIDAMNYRHAVQLCNKILKKTPDSKTVLALKALSLLRDGSATDAEVIELGRRVKAMKPTDAATMQALTATFKSLRLYDDIVDMYEQAYAAMPYNEEWANHWFMALVRAGNFKGCQLAATKLHKAFKDEKYYFWAVTSVYLQATDPACTNKQLLLTLAQRMLEKGVTDGLVKNAESLQLYFFVLDELGKFDEMERLLTGDLGKLIKVEAERNRMYLDVLRKRSDWMAMARIATEQLDSNMDDWESHVALADALEQLNPDEHKDRLDQASDLLVALQDKTRAEKTHFRGPFLAKLLFASRGLATKPPASLGDLVLQYLRQFGTAISCFEDLVQFLGMIDPADRRGLAEQLASASPIQDSGLPDAGQTDFVRMDVNCRKVLRFLTSSSLTAAQCEDAISQLLARYQLSIPLGAKLDERERQPGDDYLTLAAEYILDIFVAERDPRELHRAICLLEYGIERSKFNSDFKLLLIRLYFEIGVFKRPLELIDSLSIKHVQLDTLSYLFASDLETFGVHDEAMNQFYKLSSIYISNDRETPEAILQAFKFGSFSKIPEFIKFKDRLSNSFQRTLLSIQLARAENMDQSRSLHNFKDIVDDLESSDRLAWKDESLALLHDNRDRTMLKQHADTADTLATKISGSVFPELPAAWCKIHSLESLILRKIVKSSFEETEELENALEAAVMARDSDVCKGSLSLLMARGVAFRLKSRLHWPQPKHRPAEILVAVSRLLGGRIDENQIVPAWESVLAKYTELADMIIEWNATGLTRVQAERLTALVEATIYITAAFYIALPQEPSKKGKTPKAQQQQQQKSVDPVVAESRDAFCKVLQRVSAAVDAQLKELTGLPKAAFSKQALGQVASSLTACHANKSEQVLEGTEIVGKVADNLQRSWVQSLKGFAQEFRLRYASLV
ncbi:N-acetyltransferase B complex non catalytic subunit-domain-containing protein [Entophlyctis helioformis]|nr:N-acetyltransferase B complex non catalytic subunit-domain-containing protein [Entophlyctis helioformis]